MLSDSVLISYLSKIKVVLQVTQYHSNVSTCYFIRLYSARVQPPLANKQTTNQTNKQTTKQTNKNIETNKQTHAVWRAAIVPLIVTVIHLTFESYLSYWQFSVEALKLWTLLHHSQGCPFCYIYIQGVPGGMCQTSGEWVFLMLKYTDITQNTYVQSWTVTEITAREKCGLLAGPRTVPVSWQLCLCYVVECGIIWREFSPR